MIPRTRYKTYDALCTAAANEILAAQKTAVSARGVFYIAIAGGKTPDGIFWRLLAAGARSSWQTTQFYWTDERRVPPTSPESNYGRAKSLFLDRLAIPAGNIHPFTDGEPPQADFFENMPLSRDGFPVFDFILAGIGGDGHTASLFPDGPELFAADRPVTESVAPEGYAVRRRITLTLPVLRAARRLLFTVSGLAKINMLDSNPGPVLSALVPDRQNGNTDIFESPEEPK